jgi:hypothetical protein
MRLTRREREALREFVEACKEKFGGESGFHCSFWFEG